MAKDWPRLLELAGDGSAAGAASSRMAHLFSKMAPALRAALRMDDEACFSVTDEVRTHEESRRVTRSFFTWTTMVFVLPENVMT